MDPLCRDRRQSKVGLWRDVEEPVAIGTLRQGRTTQGEKRKTCEEHSTGKALHGVASLGHLLGYSAVPEFKPRYVLSQSRVAARARRPMKDEAVFS